MAGKMKKVLVLNIGGIGDMVMATPALACLAHYVRGGRLDILTVKRSAPVIEAAPFVGRVYTADVSALTGKPGLGGLIRLLASLVTLIRLRANRYDLGVDLMAVESRPAARRRKFLIDLIGPARRAGRNTNGWADYLDVKVAEDLSSAVHEVDRKTAVVGALLGDVKAPDMRVFTTRQDSQAAKRLVESLLVEGSRGLAILVPGAWRPTRRWDPEGFIAVGNHLAGRHRLSVAVCGSADEGDILSAVAREIPGAGSLIDVPPRVLFEVIGRCDIMITNDTGPMHIAAAAKKPGIVAIFGPENPDRYAPRRSGRVVVISDRAACSPCVRYSCDDMHCLTGIGVDRVVSAVDTLLAEGGRRARKRVTGAGTP